MINGLNISLSGINAAKSKLDVAAVNIANSTVPEAKSLQSNNISQSSGSVPAGVSSNLSLSDNNINLEKEITDIISATASYKANIFAAKVQSEAEEELINTIL